MAVICKNCETRFKGHFCNNCGQAADTHDVNFHYFWHDIQHGVFHFDQGILYTTQQLFTRPGHAIRDFINGKRVRHMKPLAFVFLVCTIYGLLIHFFNLEHFNDTVQIGSGEANAIGGRKIIDNLAKASLWLRTHYAYMVLLSLPIVSLASYLTFRKAKINYLKHVVLNAYIIGQKTIVHLVLIPVLIFGGTGIVELTSQSQDIIDFILIVWTYAQFFNKYSVFKTIALTVLAYLCYLILLLSVIRVLMSILSLF